MYGLIGAFGSMCVRMAVKVPPLFDVFFDDDDDEQPVVVTAAHRASAVAATAVLLMGAPGRCGSNWGVTTVLGTARYLTGILPQPKLLFQGLR